MAIVDDARVLGVWECVGGRLTFIRYVSCHFELALERRCSFIYNVLRWRSPLQHVILRRVRIGHHQLYFTFGC